MIKEWVTVLSWQDGVALVRSDVKVSSCRCFSQNVCETFMLNMLGKSTSYKIFIISEQPLVKGQKVELGIAERTLICSAILVYFSPLIGLFVGAGFFQSLFSTNFAAMCGSALGMLGSLLLVGVFSSKLVKCKTWKPIILSIGTSPDMPRGKTPYSEVR